MSGSRRGGGRGYEAGSSKRSRDSFVISKARIEVEHRRSVLEADQEKLEKMEALMRSHNKKDREEKEEEKAKKSKGEKS